MTCVTKIEVFTSELYLIAMTPKVKINKGNTYLQIILFNQF